MKVDSVLKQKSLGRVLVVLLVFAVAACTSKKETTSEEPVVAPVAVEKTEVVKETPKIPKPVNVLTYGVQIGAYEMFDVEFKSDIKNIKKNGLSHYVIGNFATEKEAEELLKIMVDLSIKDAFVVKIKDGKILD